MYVYWVKSRVLSFYDIFYFFVDSAGLSLFSLFLKSNLVSGKVSQKLAQSLCYWLTKNPKSLKVCISFPKSVSNSQPLLSSKILTNLMSNQNLFDFQCLLFNPNKPFTRGQSFVQQDVDLMIDCFVSCFRIKPHNNDPLKVCLNPVSPSMFHFVLVSSLYRYIHWLLLSQIHDSKIHLYVRANKCKQFESCKICDLHL